MSRVKSENVRFGFLPGLLSIFALGLLIFVVVKNNTDTQPATTVRDWGIFESHESFKENFIPFNLNYPTGNINLSDIVPEDYGFHTPTGGYTEAFQLNLDPTSEEWEWFFDGKNFMFPSRDNVEELAASIKLLSEGLSRLSDRIQEEGLSPRNYDMIQGVRDLLNPLLMHPLLDDLAFTHRVAQIALAQMLNWFKATDAASDPNTNQRLN